MNDKMDELLKEALAPMDEPSELLNHRVLRKGKESLNMKKKTKRKISAAAVAASCILALSGGTAIAAYRYLTPHDLAVEQEDKGLEKIFASENAIEINESQEIAGYRITLLGIASGDEVTKVVSTLVSGEEMKEIKDYSYTMIAIERADGTPIRDTEEFPSEGAGIPELDIGFFVQGVESVDFNVFHNGQSAMGLLKDGVEYQMIAMDNVEMFADRDIYLRVTTDTTDAVEHDIRYAYDYDTKTGKITRNPDYWGINALFRLPIDESKADPEAAKAYLAQMEEKEANDPDIEKREKKGAKAVKKWMKKITPDNLEKYATPIKSSKKTKKVDVDDIIRFYSIKMQYAEFEIQIPVTALFPDRKPGLAQKFIYYYDVCWENEEDDRILLFVCTLDKEDTVTYMLYQVKD